jgi:hypothetical protein
MARHIYFAPDIGALALSFFMAKVLSSDSCQLRRCFGAISSKECEPDTTNNKTAISQQAQSISL